MSNDQKNLGLTWYFDNKLVDCSFVVLFVQSINRAGTKHVQIKYKIKKVKILKEKKKYNEI